MSFVVFAVIQCGSWPDFTNLYVDATHWCVRLFFPFSPSQLAISPIQTTGFKTYANFSQLRTASSFSLCVRHTGCIYSLPSYTWISGIFWHPSLNTLSWWRATSIYLTCTLFVTGMMYRCRGRKPLRGRRRYTRQMPSFQKIFQRREMLIPYLKR